MKLTAFILLSACLVASASGHSQNITLNVKDAPLEKVFSEVSKQSGYEFLYATKLLQNARKVNIAVKNASIQEILAICFKDQPFSYTIIEKTIVVKPKTESPNEEATTEPPPPIDVHGRIVNEKGEPVAGASVKVKGTNKGTSSNDNGEFILTGVDANAILAISGVNIESFEVNCSSFKTGEIKLMNAKTKIVTGEEVEIKANTGYQIVKPNEVTGSLVVLSKEQLDKRVAPDIISKLEGITNGLVFNKNADNGTNKLRIRGESTIFAVPDPLIVVDNFPYSGNINDINPNDIESVTVLKDAAAASIWGVQAGNGVIVITTKKGKFNKPLSIELNTNYTITQKPDLFYFPQIEPTDYIDVETFLFKQGFYNSTLSNSDLPVVSPVIEILNKRKLGQISSADSANMIDKLRGLDLRNSMNKYYYQTAVHQQYQINISGGAEKLNYYFSTGYDKDLPNTVGIEKSRVTLNSQANFLPVKNLKMGVGIVYDEDLSTGNGATTIPNSFPYTQLTDANGNQVSIPQRRITFEDTISNHGFLNWKYYPIQEKSLVQGKSKIQEINITSLISYKVVNGLSLDFTYQYQTSKTTGKSLSDRQSYEVRNQMNKFAILNNGNYIGSNFPDGSILGLSSSSLISNSGRINLTYSKNWKRNSISGIAGFDVREVRTESNSSMLYGYNVSNGSFIMPNLFVQYPQYPSGIPSVLAQPGVGIAHQETIDRFRSKFANVGYTFNSRYIINGSVRFDGTNYFGVKTNQKTLPLWASGIKWNINKERFFTVKWLSLLDLRVTYGFQGNLNKSIAAVTTIQYRGTEPVTGLPFAGITNYPNPDLRWEKIGHLNIGVDFALKNNRFSGSLELFQKKGKDLIGDAPLDPTTGVITSGSPQIRGNFSAMTTKGFDLQIHSILLPGKFNWTNNFIFNYANDKVTKYDITTKSPSTYLGAYRSIVPIVGQPLYSLYSYHWAGIDPATGGPMIYLADTINKSYTSANANNIKVTDLFYKGRYNPPIVGSMLNTFSWKGLELSINLTFKLNYYFRRNSINYYQLVNGGWQSAHKDYALRWQKPGDENFTSVPSFVYPVNGFRDDYYLNSDILLERGDHIRIQYVNLAYKLPISITSKLHLKDLQVYFYANNLGILWRANDKHIDPDYPYVSYPSPKSYSFGIKSNF